MQCTRIFSDGESSSMHSLKHALGLAGLGQAHAARRTVRLQDCASVFETLVLGLPKR